MPQKKTLVFSAEFDTRQFDRDVEKMERKLRQLRSTAGVGQAHAAMSQRVGAAGLGAVGMAEGGFVNRESRRELDAYIREQSSGQERLLRLIGRRLEFTKSLTRELERQKALGGDVERVQERISRSQEQAARLRETYMRRDADLRGALSTREAMAPGGLMAVSQAFRDRGVGGAMGALRGMATPANILRGLGGISSAAGGAVLMADPIVRQNIAMERMTQVAGGRGTQLSSEMLGSIYSGRSVSERLFDPQRREALQGAMREMRQQEIADKVKLAGGTAMVTGGLMGVGAGIAGALPTGGLSLAASIAGIGGALYGGYSMLSNERMRALGMGALGFEGHQRRYRSILAGEAAEAYQSRLEALKNMDPTRRMAGDQYMQQFMPNLQMQRSLGIGNAQFYGPGGFLQGGMQAGFTREDMMGAAQAIQAAGGGTAMSRRAVTALQYARGSDLTNAPQLFGQIGGTLGGPAQTEEAVVRMLAEGNRRGFDSSKLAEETRRFTAAAASLISRSGARGVNEAARVAGSFAQFTGETTTRGVEAAQTAYGLQQQISSQGSGIRGAMQFAFMQNNPALRKLNRDQRLSLVNMSEQEINAGGAEISAMAASAGMSVSEFQRSAIRMKRQAVSTRATTDEQRQSLRERTAGMSLEEIRRQKPLFNELGEYISAFRAEDEGTFKGMGPMALESFALAQIRGEQAPADVDAVMTRQVRGRGRMEDTTRRAQAREQESTLEVFRDLSAELRSSAKATIDSTTDMVRAFRKLTEDLEGEDATEAFKRFYDSLDRASDRLDDMGGGGLQPQGNVPGAGG